MIEIGNEQRILQKDIKEVEITLKVTLFREDNLILKILSQRPNHHFRMREILAILQYEGIYMSIPMISKKLDFLATLDMIKKKKEGKYYIYQIEV